MNQEVSQYPLATTDAAIIVMYRVCQIRFKSLNDNNKRSLAATEVLDHTNVGLGEVLTGKIDKTLKDDFEINSLKATACHLIKAEIKTLKMYLGWRFFVGANKTHIANVTIYLKNKSINEKDK